ncbi:hypothetical protein HOO65_020407 [Ceratocystis lukuohia]|uniref:Chromo domain-containing protein n=1 Tax=Ceratocystis lukuohia TaxID=2019550 RepID=A0ABR4MNQ0_9PEZI
MRHSDFSTPTPISQDAIHCTNTATTRTYTQQYTTQHPQSRVVIDIPHMPSPYIPGSGPVSRDATIVPVSDSTAYIIGQVFLSEGFAADGKLRPKSLAWLIGFRDRPAARIVVRAYQVYDYVSPRELEEYEYRQWLQREEEKERLTQAIGDGFSAEIDAAVVRKLAKRAPGRPGEPHPRKVRKNHKAKRKPGHRDLTTPGVQTPSEVLSEADVRKTTAMVIPPVKTTVSSISVVPKKRKISALDEAATATGSDTTEREGTVSQNNFSTDGFETEDTKMHSSSQASPHKRVMRESEPARHSSTDILAKPNPPQTTHSINDKLTFDQAGARDRDENNNEEGNITPIPNAKSADTALIPAKTSGWVSINGSSVARHVQTTANSEPPIGENLGQQTQAFENDFDNEDVREELGDDEYIVAAIEDVKNQRGKLLFLVRWAGDWPPDQQRTWEPYENINEAMTTSYLLNNPIQAKAAKASKFIARLTKREAQGQHNTSSSLNKIMSAFQGDLV